MSINRSIAFSLFASLSCVVCGCYDDPEPQPGIYDGYYNVVIDRAGPTGFEAILPTAIYQDPALFGERLPWLYPFAAERGLRLRLLAGNAMAEEMVASFGDVGGSSAGLEAPSDGEVGRASEALVVHFKNGYTFSMDDRPVYAPVRGCVDRDAWKMSFRLNRNSDQVFDIHIAGWRDPTSGRICMGVYESVSHWDLCLCDAGPSVRLLEQAMVAIGMAAGTAWMLAQMAAPHAEAILSVL